MNGLTDSGEAGHHFIQPEPARSLSKKSDANNYVVLKFTYVASSCCFRSCLYAWLGSLPRSLSGRLGVFLECPSPIPQRFPPSQARWWSDNSILVLHSSDSPTCGASCGNFFRDLDSTLASSTAPSRFGAYHIVGGASEVILSLVFTPALVATLSLRTGFLL